MQTKRAFTLVELIVTLTIFGIISSISADIFVKIYNAYLTSKHLSEIEIKTELALEIITKRLQNRIPGSVIASKNPDGVIYGKDFVILSEADDKFKNIEWISLDMDMFLGKWDGKFYKPNWSGLIDLYHPESNVTTIISPGSSFNNIDFSHRAIIFDKICSPLDYGLHNPSSHNCSLKIKRVLSDTKLLLEDNPKQEIVERYYIAKEAYAVVHEGDDEDFNLTLRYNYRPWEGENYNSPNAKKSLLIEHVNKFSITQTKNDTAIYVKLCVLAPFIDEEKNNFNASICKEKAIF